jgi:predicted ATPase
VPRHRTMQAAVDWSYGLLSPEVQRFFRVLGIFAGGFSCDAAASVVTETAAAGADTIDRLADLVAKSLVVADVSGPKPRFRLLDTIRTFALEKLDASGDHKMVALLHAEYYRRLFEQAEGQASTPPSDEPVDDCAPEIDNLRAALDWAFSADGDGSVGVALTNAGFPLWMRLSLLEECRGRAQRALATFGTEEIQNPREQMRLHAALGATTSDPSEMGAAFAKTLEIARSLGDVEYQLRALRGLYFCHAGNSQYRIALPLAETFHALATGRPDSNDRLFGERTIGVAKHFVGDQAGARRHLEEVLSNCPSVRPERGVVPFQDIVRFGTDLRVSAGTFLARVLWLQGFPDQSVRAAETAIEQALATGHAQSLCYTLTLGACQVALWTGDLAAAQRHTDMLVGHARKHCLPFWGELGARLQRVVNLKNGNFESDPRLPPSGHDKSRPRGFNFLILLGEVVEAQARAGLTAEALQQIDQGIDRSEADWLTPELFRLKGKLLLKENKSGAAETAGQYFRKARDEARCQGASSWELRATTNLAELLRDRGQTADAIACLEPIYKRFTEGLGTADLIAGRRLLDDLSAAGRR